jgi:plasmid stability protein
MKQLKISLPDDLRDALDVAAEKSERSLGEEIRQRVERAFAEDRLPAETRELIAAVVELTRQLDQLGMQWRQKPKARATLVAAIAEWLEQTKPAGSSSAPGGAPAGAPDLFYAAIEPKTAGLMLARQVILQMRNTKELIERHSEDKS